MLGDIDLQLVLAASVELQQQLVSEGLEFVELLADLQLLLTQCLKGCVGGFFLYVERIPFIGIACLGSVDDIVRFGVLLVAVVAFLGTVGSTDQRGSAEDYGYQSRDDRYLAKNNYIDTVGELNLVAGVDDRFQTLFGSQFTVYGDCKINIGSLQDPKLIAAIIFLSAKSADDPVIQDPQKLWTLAKRVGDARSYGVYFDDLNAFADYVKNPDGALQDLLSGADGTTPPLGAASAAQGLEPVQGVELDGQKLGQVASSGPRRLYRVEVTSTVGKTPRGEPRFQRKFIGIWDTQVQNQNFRNPDYRRGSWVFWREE